MPTKITKVDGIPAGTRKRAPMLPESEKVLAEINAGGTMVVEGDQAAKVIRQVRESVQASGRKIRTASVNGKDGAFYVQVRTGK